MKNRDTFQNVLYINKQNKQTNNTKRTKAVQTNKLKKNSWVQITRSCCCTIYYRNNVLVCHI